MTEVTFSRVTLGIEFKDSTCLSEGLTLATYKGTTFKVVDSGGGIRTPVDLRMRQSWFLSSLLRDVLKWAVVVRRTPSRQKRGENKM